ncbi:hypothetical protein [Clostridium botulinum]|uniref:Uncharacterized protein n=1 Tax=Clostridium botulinum TaxID=1491 RepID=A0A9Q1UWH4_CLOBO|nr:hypothetical protein [Clostridium botulinum]AEB77244.1 hypothetical protein CbC4_4043 [Clostridium botulinum BKT015925]KEH96246.1 hypothetical protein Y848_13215 [Clostridium botulinum C/D str. Sp77]KLU74346.1 hypothetical protein CBC3_p0044 [Clostridium botulinum V891]KOA80440.1 hypothetical protein ADU77_01200 [Clostridium botulinum]KOA82630.1 hypothetical protein ADU74_13215 [Clostridium botulinum]
MCQENQVIKHLKDEVDIIDKNLQKLENQRYSINKEYINLLQEECKKNIGRCFKRMKNGVISYCKIIDIDEPILTISNYCFNEHQYPALWFNDSYKSSLHCPFYKENLFSGAWGKGNDIIGNLNGITYEEISNTEYMEKFKEINDKWIKALDK